MSFASLTTRLTRFVDSVITRARGAAVCAVALCAFAGVVRPACAVAESSLQQVQTADAPEPGSNLSVSLMTLGPGDLVYEFFGHNGIVIRDNRTGSDLFYNWGVFSFDEPGYIRKFIQGRMTYWMEPWPTEAVVEGYRQMNRSVYLQELNLTNEQKVALQDFLIWNAQPENKFYRYDYYRDNCSTRVRDALDRALGGILRAQLDTAASETYRTETQRLSYRDILMYTGLMIGLGPLTDQPLTKWDDGFIPLRLREWVREVTVTDENGVQRPLVAVEATIFEADRPATAERAPFLLPYYIIAGLMLAAVFLLLGRWAVRSGTGRIVFGILATVFTFVTGLLGVLLAFLWAFTDHEVAYRNENLFQLNPLALALMVTIIVMLFRKEWASRAAMLSIVVGGFAFLGFLLQLYPGFQQANGEVIALFMPANIALAWVLGKMRPRVEA